MALTALHHLSPFRAQRLSFLLLQVSETLLQAKRLQLGVHTQLARTQMLHDPN